MLMLAEAVHVIEDLPARVVSVRLMKRKEDVPEFVYTIMAKTTDGWVQTFQLRGRQIFKSIYHMDGKHKSEEVLFFTFENHDHSILEQMNAKKE
ncbi:hypothetical protein [Enterococcus sp. AD013-P3]|uniref:hypothetical protein n=1 Tax=Enterococcus sp. AD013-P3 TaxID=3411036 RepID=UPI003B93BEF6